MKLGQQSVLECHLQRLRAANIPLMLAIPDTTPNDMLADFARDYEVPFFRGSEDDVLSRYYHCARNFSLTDIVRVTSDCPLIDGDLIALAHQSYLRASTNDEVYLSNCVQRSYPRGFDFEFFSMAALTEAFEQAREPVEREHVTPYIRNNRSGNVTIKNFCRKKDASRFRITLDTLEDYQVLKLLVEQHHCAGETAEGIIAQLEKNPEIAEINKNVEQKA